MKDYIRQIQLELKLLTKSKLFKIGAILLILISLFGITFGHIVGAMFKDDGYNSWNEPVVVRDITVTNESDMFWEVREAVNSLQYLVESGNIDNGSEEYIFADDLIYLFAKASQSELDYLANSLTRQIMEAEVKKFIVEKEYKTLDEVGVFYGGNANDYYFPFSVHDKEGLEKILKLTDEEKVTSIKEWNDEIERKSNIVVNSDYIEYYKVEIELTQERIKDFQEEIVKLEENMVDGNQTEIQKQIDGLKNSIESFETRTIPTLEYKIANDVKPKDDWRNDALNARDSFLSRKAYGPMKEEEFLENEYLIEEHGSYAKYLKVYQEQLAKDEKKYLIAVKALELNKPDIFYDRTGSREVALGFLSFSTMITLFGIMLSANTIAREFQNGTVRLLLIRPKTRIKIFGSKLIAILILLLALHFITQFGHMLAVGIDQGFAAFAYPKINPYSTTPFVLYFIWTLLITYLPIVSLSSLAFAVSALLRRNAPSIALVMGAFFGSSIVSQMAMFMPKLSWVKWTPIPYFQFHQYFTGATNMYYSNTTTLVLGNGIIILVALSALSIGLGLWNLKVRDVTN